MLLTIVKWAFTKYATEKLLNATARATAEVIVKSPKTKKGEMWLKKFDEVMEDG